MTPVIANSKKKSHKQSKGRASDSANAEDDWRPEQGKDSGGGTDDDEASQDEWEDDEEYGSSSSKKRKKSVKAESKPKVKGAKSGGSKAAPSYWSQDELLNMYGVMHRMLLSSVSTIRQEAGLQHRTAGHVMMKLRSEFKKTERALGGDGKWIDDFRLGRSRKGW